MKGAPPWKNRIVESGERAAGEFLANPKNWRVHPKAQREALTGVLSEVGWVQSVIVNRTTGNVVDGHARIEEALKLGDETPVPFVEVELTEAEEAKILATIDPISAMAGADKSALDSLLHEVETSSAAVGEMLAQLAESNGLEYGGENVTDADAEPEIDRAEELRAKWQTETGQLWRIGEHRLLCGDSTRREDVERVMGGERAECVFTDPPYGVSVGAKNRLLNSVQPSGRNLTDIVDDDLSPEELKTRLVPAFQNVRTIAASDDCTYFVCAPQGGELGMMMMMMMDAGLKVRHVLIWKKNSPTFSMGRLDYDYQHEPILLTWCKRHNHYGKGQFKTSVWDIDKPRSSKEHPTMKPVELYVNGYLNNSADDAIVFEPYAGSGTAFVAAQQLGRKCRAIEISPAYVAVILERMKTAFPLLEIAKIE